MIIKIIHVQKYLSSYHNYNNFKIIHMQEIYNTAIFINTPTFMCGILQWSRVTAMLMPLYVY
jgi:NADPH-dependent 7-cyano-7-deazaguanine reductase QueF